MKAYEKDLAYIHDVGFGGFARSAAPGLLNLLEQRGIEGGRVVDLGCGTGIWAEALHEAGYEVVGVDISEEMIERARRRVPDGTFYAESFLEYELPRCRAVTAIGEGFNYLFDEDNSLETLSNLFRRVYSALETGGLFVFDLVESGWRRGSSVRFSEGEDWAIVSEVEEDREQNRMIRRITTFREVDGCYRRDREIHELRLYDRSDMAQALRRAGFRLSIAAGYGRQEFSNGQVAFIAEKR